MKGHLDEKGQRSEETAEMIPEEQDSEENGDSERMRRFRERKEKEQRRRRRNRILLRGFLLLLITVLMGVVIYLAVMVMDSYRSNREGDHSGEEIISGEITSPEAVTTEPETEEPTTQEPTTQEPTTEEPDPREDVWNHYRNMFVASKINNYLNVRDRPTQDGNIIGKLVKYAGGEILENLGNGWYHILSGGIDGYIAGDYCAIEEEAKSLAIEHCFEMVEVTAEKLNVRSGPGEEYDIWTQLSATEKLVVDETVGDWLKISINSSYGYISREFTQKGYYLVEAMPWSSISGYSATRQQLFAYAEQFLGTPYVYGGESLTGGIDCSSYVKQCFKNAIGISLPRTSNEQVQYGVPVALADAKPGDLLFYADERQVINHVAMYLGDGKILHAAQSFGQVIISKYNYATEPVAIRNIIGD